MDYFLMDSPAIHWVREFVHAEGASHHNNPAYKADAAFANEYTHQTAVTNNNSDNNQHAGTATDRTSRRMPTTLLVGHHTGSDNLG